LNLVLYKRNFKWDWTST